MTIGVVGVTSLFAGSQLVALGREVPTYQSTIQAKLRDLRETLSRRGVLDSAAPGAPSNHRPSRAQTNLPCACNSRSRPFGRCRPSAR